MQFFLEMMKKLSPKAGSPPAEQREKGQETTMYGLIGKINAVSGQRAALINILVEGIAGMPGCLIYIVAEDQSDEDAIWVTFSFR